jgi:hypothetical protein
MADRFTSVRVRVLLEDHSTCVVDVSKENMAKVGYLPGGQAYRMELPTSNMQLRHVAVKPYYRKVIDGILNIYCVEVGVPHEEKA